MSSKSRPIHNLHRPLVSTPDEAEPSYSYEQESFLGGREEDVEDDFYRRLGAGSRRESSGSQAGASSFWRSSKEADASERGPSFSSVNMDDEQIVTVKERTGSALSTCEPSPDSEREEQVRCVIVV